MKAWGTTLWRVLTEDTQAHLFLALALLVKVVMAIGLFEIGFSGVSADEYGRSITAMEWARAPYLVTGATVWPPFELYLDGLLLKLIPNPLWVPRVTVFIASCALIIYFYQLVRLILGSPFAAAASSLGLLISPWYAWMSATPMLDVYYLTAVIAGLYYGTLWVLESDTSAVYLAAFAFFVATGFHYQAWLTLACIDLVSLWVVWNLFEAKDYPRLRQMFTAYLIAHAYILFTMLTTYLETGNPVFFMAGHNSYSKWYYNYDSIPLIRKVLHYPAVLVREANPIFLVLAVYGAFQAFRTESKLFRTSWLAMLGGLLLFALSMMNISSVPATAAPGRFSLGIYILLLPYAGLACAQLASRPQPAKLAAGGLTRAQWRVMGPLIVGILLGLNQVRQLPMSPDMNGAIAAGHDIHELLDKEGPDKGYLIELNFWEFMGVELTAGHYDRMQLDRHYDIQQRNLPSLLEGDPLAFATRLREEQIVAMAFRTPELITSAKQYGEVISQHAGGWVVLSIP